MKVEIEWIPCAERLPPTSDSLLVAARNGDVWSGYYDAASAEWVSDTGTPFDEGDVVFWARMPLAPIAATAVPA